MNRISLLALALSLCSWSFAQDLTKKISLEVPASRAALVVTELGRAAGLRMEAAGNVKDDVFVISVKDASVDDVMQRIAKAEAGKWILQNGIYILSRENST